MDRKNLWGILGAAILFFSIIVFATNINLSHPYVQAQSCSNYPTVSPGNIILVQDTDFQSIEKGETVIYRAPSEEFTVIHQVTNITENSLQTKGENNQQQLSFEKDVEPSQIWGTPAFVIPFKTGPECVAN